MTKSNSPNGELIATIIREGKLVPPEITIELLRNRMNETPERTFLIDGFPRAIAQALTYQRIVGNLGVGLIYLCIESEEVLTQRLIKRGKTSQRTDDNHTSILKRFQTFKNDTEPVFTFFKEHSHVLTVNGDQEIDVVAECLATGLRNIGLIE
eukprot:TRINITY_DN2115_c0_g2_i1.p1 TRINITY_DN2115_c0_g2~~TRINITY_DN2115_c0_g2_i1.p1  ORF type:complete len:153 (+),score=33.01 TRINITY_DN2115_c0_g2_i1:192-650(+)